MRTTLDAVVLLGVAVTIGVWAIGVTHAFDAGVHCRVRTRVTGCLGVAYAIAVTIRLNQAFDTRPYAIRHIANGPFFGASGDTTGGSTTTCHAAATRHATAATRHTTVACCTTFACRATTTRDATRVRADHPRVSAAGQK